LGAGRGVVRRHQAANASPLQAIEGAALGVINALTQVLFGRSLVW